MPWGERKHGAEGLCESYAESLKIEKPEVLLPFIERIILNNISPRESCPCGSGIAYRNCHRKFVLRFLIDTPVSLINSDYHAIYKKFTEALCRRP
jgi:hypothetical protein